MAIDNHETVPQRNLEGYMQALDSYASSAAKAAQDAHAIGEINYLQLEYREALHYYELAHELDPQNQLYAKAIEDVSQKMKK